MAQDSFQLQPWQVRVRNTAWVQALAKVERTVPFWPRAALERRQRHNLASMVRHAWATVPFYRRAMDERGLTPHDFRSADDLERLPLVDAQTMQTRIGEFLSTAYDESERDVSYTSGSASGVRREIWWHYNGTLHGQALLERMWPVLMNLAGEGRTRRVMRDMAGETVTKAVLSRLGRPTESYRRMNIIPGDGSSRPMRDIWAEYTLMPRTPTHEKGCSPLLPFEAIAERINEVRPRIVFSFGSFLEQFVRWADRSGAEVAMPRVWSYTGDAPSLAASELAERRYGCLTHSAYQTTEAGRIGFQCERRGGLHLNVDLVAVRVVDQEGRTLPPGEPGEVVISSLRNRAMPFLNYRMGDVARLEPEPCECGRTLPLMSQLEGRRTDFVELADGRELSSLSMESLFRSEFEPTLKVQLVQDVPGQLVWRIVPYGDVDRTALREAVLAKADAVLGEAATVDVDFVDDIPFTARGKFERVVAA